jgi:16S rRNA (uracil1498-N3)-methyltransferase
LLSFSESLNTDMHIFYTPNIDSDEFVLNEEESKHCVRVLRLKEQDTISLIDGRGGFYHARIVDANPKCCKVFVYHKNTEYGKRNYQLSIAIAPTKNIERLEWFLEKSTEIGIDRIIPMVCAQSERKIIKPERLTKIIAEAIKQSKQAYIPVLENLCSFGELIQKEFSGLKFIAYCDEDFRPSLKNVLKPCENVLILIGPEGDFSPEEIKTALAKGYEGVSLGNSRLRTETAGVVACHTVCLVNEI